MTREIRDDDHVTRYCKRSDTYEDGTPSPAAFKLRNAEEYLSVNWLEYFRMPDIQGNMTHVQKEYNNHRESAKSGKFAVLNVGDLKI